MKLRGILGKWVSLDESINGAWGWKPKKKSPKSKEKEVSPGGCVGVEESGGREDGHVEDIGYYYTVAVPYGACLSSLVLCAFSTSCTTALSLAKKSWTKLSRLSDADICALANLPTNRAAYI